MIHIKIKNLRENYGFTQKQVANLLNVDRSTYSYYETGRTFPSISTIIRLSELYSVSCDYLIKNSIKLANPTNIYDFPNRVCEKECELLCCFRMLPTNVQNKIMDAMKKIVKEITRHR